MQIQDVLPLQNETEETMAELVTIRGGVLFQEGHIHNRTDDELNKVCQLLSLCFMTIGKWHESKIPNHTQGTNKWPDFLFL